MHRSRTYYTTTNVLAAIGIQLLVGLLRVAVVRITAVLKCAIPGRTRWSTTEALLRRPRIEERPETRLSPTLLQIYWPGRNMSSSPVHVQTLSEL
jgi:hypothetical protein